MRKSKCFFPSSSCSLWVLLFWRNALGGVYYFCLETLQNFYIHAKNYMLEFARNGKILGGNSRINNISDDISRLNFESLQFFVTIRFIFFFRYESFWKKGFLNILYYEFFWKHVFTRLWHRSPKMQTKFPRLRTCPILCFFLQN